MAPESGSQICSRSMAWRGPVAPGAMETVQALISSVPRLGVARLVITALGVVKTSAAVGVVTRMGGRPPQ
ncbi:hypothetical protein [Streptomyces sp. URMC 129]|uniref:hypothetical protein n=1 Tax=Streptomyces sp. URMC 129 TaxID=3423407 RepID=UPI003F1A8591